MRVNYFFVVIEGLHHVGLTTRDQDRLTAFYRDLIFGEVVRTFSWEVGDEEFDTRLGLKGSAGRIALLRFKAASMEIIEFSDPAPDAIRTVDRPGFSHVCSAVDNCSAEYGRLLAAGMAFHAPPLRMPRGTRFTYGRDPDGNIVEILEPPPA